MSSKLLKDFEILKRLGEGTYANVFKVKRREDNEIYALKKVKLRDLNKKGKDCFYIY